MKKKKINKKLLLLLASIVLIINKSKFNFLSYIVIYSVFDCVDLKTLIKKKQQQQKQAWLTILRKI